MKPQLLVIVGPTASGKSSLGEALALAYDGEIISADSRQVYRGLDLGSGKERLKVPQRLIDIKDPEERFTVMEWCDRARQEIDELLAAGRLPIIVGGTGLYVSALLDGYDFAPEGDVKLKESLAAMSTAELVAELKQTNAPALEGLDTRNHRYLERAVEKTRLGWRAPTTSEPLYDALVLLADWPRPELYARIDRRLDDRLRQGLLGEVQGLIKDGVSADWLKRLGLEYRYLTDYLEGRYKSLNEAVERLKFATHHFARRQLIWWRRRSAQMVPQADVKTAKKLVEKWRRVGI
jgi:tRNA dimethylallyltransferase